MLSERLARWLPTAALLFLVTLLVTDHIVTTYAQPFRVEQSSMNPGLVAGDIVLATDQPHLEYGAIITTDAWADELYVKRLIGLPGDTIQFVDGQLYRNGERIDEPYGFPSADTYTVHLQEDEYWLLGDNRPRSSDSRKFGPVSAEHITYQVWTTVHHTEMSEPTSRKLNRALGH